MTQFRGREEEEDSSEEDEGLDDAEESSSEEEEEMADWEGDDVERELEMEIEKRFETDETNIVGVTKLLSGYKVPTLEISASRQHETPQHLLLQGIQPLLVNRESLFQTCQPISVSLAHKLLLSCYKYHSAFGCWDPIQAKLMESESIIPLIVVELELDEVEVNKRRLEDSTIPKQPHLKNDGSEILHNSSDYFKEEVEHVRRYYQEQHQNWFIFNGLKNKWWILTNILKEVCISVKHMQSYTERTQSGQAACISRLCITPKQLACQLGEFGQYCPVCLALHQHLVDLSDDAALTHAAEYRTHYYKLCDQNHLQKFLSTPDQFVVPNCPHTLPQPHLLPRKLTETQAFNPKSPEHVRQMYKRKLALFEEDCALIPYQSSAMGGAYKPPGERSKDFEDKLNRFLSFGAPGAKTDL
uniref:Adenylate kinase domain containing 1 n=1 Tax=Nothobranchius rachovii TaxID=451742 RepID=A0A1A8NH94_9TELE